MAQLSLSLLFLILSLFYFDGSAEPASAGLSPASAFIEASCRSTRYPQLCLHCLSGYANSTQQSPQQLAQIALSVSLVKARYTRAYVLEVAHRIEGIQSRDNQAVKDCLEQINDGVDRLSQSIREIRRMAPANNGDFVWHMSNVETWVSAALTDASTCIDEFSGPAMGGKVKATIKARVVNVAQVTSNALALFHQFTARHRATGSTNKP